MTELSIVAGYAMREALRRRVFVVVLLLTAAFLLLYVFATREAFQATEGFSDTASELDIDRTEVAGAFLLGLGMFMTLFLGVILGSFLTHAAIRGDADRGLLQPLVVRPIGRATLLLGRYAGAAVTTMLYVVVVFLLCVAITGATGGWWPDRIVAPAAELAGAAGIVVALSLLGSIVLSATANGIAVFMVFGTGLVGGLLGQIAEAIGSPTLEDIAVGISWALPFEALYQDALAGITADTGGTERLLINLGPFGGARSGGAGIWAWAAGFTAIVGLAGVGLFRRRDL